MIREYTSQIEFFEHEPEILNSPNDETSITVMLLTEVTYWDDDQIDMEYCKEHNIRYSKGKIQSRGAGVFAAGSIVVVAKRIQPVGSEAIGIGFAKALVEYLKSRGIESVRQDNNDILVDDGKVASGGETITTKYGKEDEGSTYYMAYLISVNQDVETINNVCKRLSIKPPKALSEYGITTEDIVEFCKEYWTNH